MKPQTEHSVCVDTVTYLAHAVAIVREHGFVPVAAVEEEPTWRAALARLERRTDLAPADVHRAHQILGVP